MKGRARTAAWRNDLDRRRCPEASVIGMSLVAALVTSNDLRNATAPELRFVTAALSDLEPLVEFGEFLIRYDGQHIPRDRARLPFCLNGAQLDQGLHHPIMYVKLGRCLSNGQPPERLAGHERANFVHADKHREESVDARPTSDPG